MLALGEESSTKATVEHELLLEAMFERSRRGRISRSLPFRRLRNPVQGVPLRFGFKATNLAESPFPGSIVKAIRIDSRPSGASKIIDTDFAIPKLNPAESAEYWFDKTLILPFDGTAWVSCTLDPPDASDHVRTFQGVGAKTPKPPNEWGTSLYIEQKLAVIQTKTNRLLLVLTALTAAEGIVGLKVIFTWIVDRLRAFLQFLLERMG